MVDEDWALQANSGQGMTPLASQYLNFRMGPHLKAIQFPSFLHPAQSSASEAWDSCPKASEGRAGQADRLRVFLEPIIMVIKSHFMNPSKLLIFETHSSNIVYILSEIISLNI
jgi:hypothetical protein